MTDSLATQVLAFEGIETPQWKLTSLSLVNWGIHTYSTAQLDPESTAIMGATGSGKSTYMDAYIALMMDGNAQFNTASNEGGVKAGRRDLVSYVRGQLDDTEDAESRQVQAEYMRANDKPSWSAIGGNFSNGTNDLSAVVLFYVNRGATSRKDVPRLWIIHDKPVTDLRNFAPNRAEKFTKERAAELLPGCRAFVSQSDFLNELYVRLKIGDAGAGHRAMKLALQIQQGVRLDSIDEVYRTTVMDEPTTFAKAAEAVTMYDDLRDAHARVKEAADQQLALADLPATFASYQSARADMETVSELAPLRGNGQWRKWILEKEHALLQDKLTELSQQVAEKDTEHAACQTAINELDAELDKLTEVYRASGGQALAELDRQIRDATSQVERAQSRRDKANTALGDLGPIPDAETDFLAWQEQAAVQHAALDAPDPDANAKMYSVMETRSEARRTLAALQVERHSLDERTGLVSAELDTARNTFAHASNTDREMLPFVAELIDVKPEFEQWRPAIELALGGFAATVLVDNRDYRHFRSSINPITAARRIRNQAVDVATDPVHSDDDRYLLGRIVIKDHPFANWLSRRLAERFNYARVDAHRADLEALEECSSLTEHPAIAMAPQRGELSARIAAAADSMAAYVEASRPRKELDGRE